MFNMPNEYVYKCAHNAVENAIFIIGTMRSGTGFLGLRLNESSSIIGCPFELRRIWSNVGNVAIASDVQGTECPSLNQNNINQVPIPSLKHAFSEEIIKNIGSKPVNEKIRFLNKNPHLCNKINLVAALFPKAKFIWTIRSLDKVVCSLKNLFERPGMQQKGIQHVWPKTNGDKQARCFNVNNNALKSPQTGERVFPGGNIRYLAEYWLESNCSMMNFANQQADRILIVPQDKLFTETRRTTKKIESFLNLMDNSLLNLENKIEYDSIENWPSPLSLSEQNTLNDFMVQNAYELNRIQNLINKEYT